MKKLLLTLICLPIIGNGSFPVLSSLQINDSIINSKNHVKTEVDSLSKYPIGNETLTEYKERLKKYGLNQNQTKKKPINWKRIIILILVALIIGVLIIWYSLVNASYSFDLEDTKLSND